MATIELKPIKLSDVLLKIKNGATDVGDYEKHVSGVTLTPTTGTLEWKGLHPQARYVWPTGTTWVAGLEFAQDWTTPNSLSRYLFEHAEEEVELTFEPVKGGPSFIVDVTIVPGAVGGRVDSVATASVSLPVLGVPTLAPLA